LRGLLSEDDNLKYETFKRGGYVNQTVDNMNNTYERILENKGNKGAWNITYPKVDDKKVGPSRFVQDLVSRRWNKDLSGAALSYAMEEFSTGMLVARGDLAGATKYLQESLEYQRV